MRGHVVAQNAIQDFIVHLENQERSQAIAGRLEREMDQIARGER